MLVDCQNFAGSRGLNFVRKGYPRKPWHESPTNDDDSTVLSLLKIHKGKDKALYSILQCWRLHITETHQTMELSSFIWDQWTYVGMNV